jgi:hypothetical protein
MNDNSLICTHPDGANVLVAARVLELYDLATQNPNTFNSLVNLTGVNHQTADNSNLENKPNLGKYQGFADFDNWGNFSSWT